MNTNTNSYFKKEKSLEDRKAEYTRIQEKYPHMVPVICEQIQGGQLPNSDRRKYLVPKDITLGQFQFVIRKRIKLSCDQALFIFVNGATLPPTNGLISDIHRLNKDDDGFLYLRYSGENTFG